MQSALECVGQLELQEVIKKKKKGLKSSDFWTKPPLAVWYIRIVIFLYRVSVFLSICGGSQQGTDNCISLFLPVFLSGCESFLPLLLFDIVDKKKKRKPPCEHVVVISVSSWVSVSRVVGGGLKICQPQILQVCVCDKKEGWGGAVPPAHRHRPLESTRTLFV